MTNNNNNLSKVSSTYVFIHTLHQFRQLKPIMTLLSSINLKNTFAFCPRRYTGVSQPSYGELLQTLSYALLGGYNLV